MSRKAITLIIILCTTIAYSQPGYSATVTFKFYDKGKMLTKDDFNKKYNLQRSGWNETGFKDSIPFHYESGTISFRLPIQKNEVSFEIENGEKTMTVIFRDFKFGSIALNIERLKFKSGTFVLTETDVKSVSRKHAILEKK